MSTKPRASGPLVGFRRGRTISLDLIHATGVGVSTLIIDVGGGTSRLADALISEGFKAVAVLDLSEKALATSKARLGAKGTQVEWIVADVTKWQPSQTHDVWHDRAALHFLTDPKDRAAYAERVSKGVCVGGHVIIGTFAPDGPERCSGLPVIRHDAATLGELLGPSFELAETDATIIKPPPAQSKSSNSAAFDVLGDAASDMSGLGQKRTLSDLSAMPALPPIADISSALRCQLALDEQGKAPR